MIYVVICAVVFMVMGYAFSGGGMEWALVYFTGALLLCYCLGWGAGIASQLEGERRKRKARERVLAQLQGALRVAGHP
jgi:uncharacterized membrane protein